MMWIIKPILKMMAKMKSKSLEQLALETKEVIVTRKDLKRERSIPLADGESVRVPFQIPDDIYKFMCNVVLRYGDNYIDLIKIKDNVEVEVEVDDTLN
jgi:c-di-GMP-binding flagellar brake protein YcgR